jgi:hypothetical protein
MRTRAKNICVLFIMAFAFLLPAGQRALSQDAAAQPNSATPAQKPVIDEQKLMARVNAAYICPNNGLSIAESAESGEDCPAGGEVTKIVHSIVTGTMSEDDILFFVSLLPQGQSLYKDLGTQACATSGKLKLDFFVMSYCPYGVRFVDTTLRDLVADLGTVVDWTPYYLIGSNDGKLDSMHGQNEVDEDLRQVCIREKWSRDKWLTYTDCFSKEIYSKQTSGDAKDWKYCAQTAGIDTTQLQSCFDKDAKTLIQKDIDAAQTYSASSSPTAVYNCSKAIVGAVPYTDAKKKLCKLIPDPKPATCAEPNPPSK